TRVIVEGGRATGMEWRSGGQPFRAAARGEVILSAGAIGTPHLMQLSGLGPAAHLSAHGISVIRDMPGVGAHLRDHLQVRVAYRATGRFTFNDDMRSPLRMAMVGLRYLLWGKGPLTVSAGYAGGFFRVQPGADRPDMQLYCINYSTTKMGDRLHPYPGFTVSACPLRPTSEGSVMLCSPDPFTAPAIDPNYLASENDRRLTVAGIRLIRDIMGQPAIQPFVEREDEPGTDITDDNGLLSYSRARAASLYHPTCTARMGDFADAVVDQCLRVRGVDGLRIVDGSVTPTLVSGNTHAPIVMIGEKASDMILEDAQI
ncbi:MAG: GMC oxidoreductase, partial [Sphingomonadales bacterium]